jgi:hypothetical protein
VKQLEGNIMRLVLLVACATLVFCGQAEARYQWLRSDGQPCEVTCRKPVSVADNGNAYVCAGHVKGAPLADVRSGMIGAGKTVCYVPGEAPTVRTDVPFLCLCSPR